MARYETRLDAIESQLKQGRELNTLVFACERELVSRYGIQPTCRDLDLPGYYLLCERKGHPGEVAATYFSEQDLALL